LTVAIQN